MATTATAASRSEVMQLLLAAHPALLSRDEIRRDVGLRARSGAIASPARVDDALEHFISLGLVHELDGFFWATRAMMAAEDAATAFLDPASDPGRR